MLNFASHGQNQAASPDTLFLDASWRQTNYRELATYYREFIYHEEDSLVSVHDYYLSNGRMQMVGTYIKEMKPANRNGRFRYFYETGVLKSTYDFYYGILHGEVRQYYENGQLRSIEQYDLGTRVDTTWTYFSNGQIHKIQVQNKDYSPKNPSDKFMQRKLISAYSKNGETQVYNGNGVYEEYFLSGKKRLEIEYENGVPHGKWTRYSGEKKKASCEMTFKEGRFIKGEIYDNGKKDIFSSLNRKAYFPSGIRGLDKFIDDHIGGCTEGFNNEVIALLYVSTDGLVELDQIISGNVNACQLEEIQNMIKNMPHWVPAVQDGKYIEGSQSIIIPYN
jgi:antitoxin component YwqK of YwqJK toxin-antitoxin module